MPLEPEVEALAKNLSAVYQDAWVAVVAEQARIEEGLATNPRLWRRRDRLREIETRISSLMDNVDAQAREWVSRDYPRVYAKGAQAAAEALGKPFAFSQVHLDAVAIHANDLYGDLLEATSFVRDTTKVLVREVVRQFATTAPVVGETAVGAARKAARLLESRGIHAVRYADGSRHGLGEYADMAVRTKTAVAYNAGTLNHSFQQGVRFFEVFDGPSCGWSAHNDSDLANGKIVSVDEAAAFAIAHPRCARSFGPRPDLETPEAAAVAEPTRGGQPLRTAEAREAASEARRAAGLVAETPSARTVAVRARNDALVRRTRAIEARKALRAQKRAVRPSQVRQEPPKPPASGIPGTPAEPPWLAEARALKAEIDGDPYFLDFQRDFDLLDEIQEIPTAKAVAQEQKLTKLGEVIDGEVRARVVARLGLDADEAALKARALELRTRARDLASNAGDAQRNAMARERFGRDFADLDAKDKIDVIQAIRALPDDPTSRARLIEIEDLNAEARDLELRAASARERTILAERAAIREVLEEVRGEPLGGVLRVPGDEPHSVALLRSRKVAPSADARDLVAEAGQVYPRSWVEASNRRGSVHAGDANRGFHSETAGDSVIAVSRGTRSKVTTDRAGTSTAVHELAHRMEAVLPKIRGAEWTFWERRTRKLKRDGSLGTPERTRRLSSLRPRQGYRPNEIAREDKFSDPYMGKDYRRARGGIQGHRTSWEIFSMGMEGIWTGSADLDADYRRFILGVLGGL